MNYILLIEAAAEATPGAQTPSSKFAVGAALLTRAGKAFWDATARAGQEMDLSNLYHWREQGLSEIIRNV